MAKCNVIGIDLAKTVFQVCAINKEDKVISNRPVKPKKMAEILTKLAPSIVAFEACGRANYWARKARESGHQILVIPPKQVAAYRQGQKTDDNDALAIALAARQPKLRTAGIKTIEQQCLQSDKRVQEHVSDQLTATGNALRALIAEFGIDIPKGKSALREQVSLILEDAENGLPLSVRESLHITWMLWQTQQAHLQELEKLLVRRTQDNEYCQRLQKLESVGVKNALLLYVNLGHDQHFKNGRQAAACFGLTPKQHSSGGKVKLGSIGKYRGNQRLRSSLIQGAQSVVSKLAKREPKTGKEHWLKALIERRGKGRAAVALANKTVRTAWAMLSHDQPYRASLGLEVAM